MSLHSDVEALARALGVWHDARRAAEPGRWTLSHSDGSFLLRQWEAAGGGMSRAKGVAVDAPTAAVILLGHARGLRVDVGECPACRGTGDERAIHRTREAEAEARLAGWWCRGGNYETGESEWYRDCVACTIDGKPTGRHLLAWERAILDAGPVRKAGAGERGTWQRIGVDGHTEILVGEDPATRTALTVLADQAQARGDKLGDVLAWWLAGPDVLGQHGAELRSIVQAAVMRCPACGGDGHYHPMPLDGMQASDSRDEAMSCTRCGGLGTVIRRQGSERVDHRAAAV